MQNCTKCHTLSPDEARCCINCGVDLFDWSETSVALKKLQENPRVIYIRISVSDDSCPACRQVEGAYAKSSPHICL